MPLARERSRMDAPSYPFLQKTSAAWARISASRRAKRKRALAGCGVAGRKVGMRLMTYPYASRAQSNVRSNSVYASRQANHKRWNYGIFRIAGVAGISAGLWVRLWRRDDRCLLNRFPLHQHDLIYLVSIV